MAKKVAVLAVNPVNGFGLFQYLESFFENGITYKVYAVADSKEIKTNSGIALTVDDVIANLKGHEDEYDAITAEKAYEDYLKDEKNSKPISELRKDLDL